MYAYLATMRIHDTTEGGATLTVGPKRRVVFKSRLRAPSGDLRKNQIKRVLAPLRRYWGCDGPTKHLDRQADPERPLMPFMEFKMNAKRLLIDAGMLRPSLVED